MKNRSCIFLFLIYLCLLSYLVQAQTSAHRLPSQNEKHSQKNKTSKDEKTEKESAQDNGVSKSKQRRFEAISLLTSLANDSLKSSDIILQCRIQSQVADALWDTDKQLARSIFRSAWEAAKKGDNESKQKGYTSPEQLPPDLRLEVLRLVARRDRALSNEFLQALKESTLKNENPARSDDGVTPNTNSLFSPLPESLSKRLNLSKNLLDLDDKESALYFAQDALSQVNLQSVYFLSALREKDASAADKQYLSLLQKVASNPLSDANTVSIASSYLFTPYTFVTVGRDGSTSINQWGEPKSTDQPPSVLIGKFLNIAAGILLRPLPIPQLERTSSGSAGTFVVLKRLLPLFEKYSQDKVPTLQAKLVELADKVPGRFHNDNDDALTRGGSNVGASDKQAAPPLVGPDNTKDGVENDEAYVRAALSSADKGDLRCREYSDGIANKVLREQTRNFVDIALVRHAIANKEPEKALLYLNEGKLAPTHRAFFYTELARLLDKNRDKSLELLNTAILIAYQIEELADRAHALVGISRGFLKHDQPLAWQTMAEAIGNINKSANFTSDSWDISLKIRTNSGGRTISLGTSNFILSGVFSDLTQHDQYSAIELARSLVKEDHRAVAIMAIARVLLKENQKNNSD
jgi:hypothetical protein